MRGIRGLTPPARPGTPAPLQLGDPFAEVGKPLLLFGRRDRKAGDRVARLAVQPLLGDVVEEGVQAVEVLLGEGVVLVVEALGTGQGRAGPDRRGRGDPVGDVLVTVLPGVGYAA